MHSHKILWALVIVNLVVTSLLAVVLYRGDSTQHYIENNGEVILNSVNGFLEQQQNQGQEDAKEKITDNEDFLYGDGNHAFLGNRNADFTIVEFLDYNCGYCKRAHTVVTELVEKNPGIKVVIVEFPILSPTSTEAAAWALAADEQGKFKEFHDALMVNKTPISTQSLGEVATSVGLDAAKTQKIAEDSDTLVRLEENKARAFQMGFQGTPGFIIGDEVLRGYAEYDAMQAIVDEQRKK